eukprot:564578-Rhodomonas_salina.1
MANVPNWECSLASAVFELYEYGNLRRFVFTECCNNVEWGAQRIVTLGVGTHRGTGLRFPSH